jgi:hypothetical protein
LKGYLCDSEEHKPEWYRPWVRIARRLLGVYSHGGRGVGWTLASGWRARLASAGLDADCNVVDSEKWQRAYRQLIESDNYDPAVSRIEEAMDEKGQGALGQKQAEAKSKPAGVEVKMAGKKITFGNA